LPGLNTNHIYRVLLHTAGGQIVRGFAHHQYYRVLDGCQAFSGMVVIAAHACC